MSTLNSHITIKQQTWCRLSIFTSQTNNKHNDVDSQFSHHKQVKNIDVASQFAHHKQTHNKHWRWEQRYFPLTSPISMMLRCTPKTSKKQVWCWAATSSHEENCSFLHLVTCRLTKQNPKLCHQSPFYFTSTFIQRIKYQVKFQVLEDQFNVDSNVYGLYPRCIKESQPPPSLEVKGKVGRRHILSPHKHIETKQDKSSCCWWIGLPCPICLIKLMVEAHFSADRDRARGLNRILRIRFKTQFTSLSI